ncbi:adenine nucleotide alpha hydrolases-like protein [Auriculariales sp. MPI-PUGE-AT-0066]|nr:adenine nucleotide alpha hydrolases-like protein [Auriculariales sp. MPI-PUGE-AT-0066]
MSLNMLKRAVSRSPSRDRARQGASSREPSPSSASERRNSFTALFNAPRRSSSPFPGALRGDYEDIPLRVGPKGLSVSAESSDDDVDDASSFSSFEFSEETYENTERNALSPMIAVDEDDLNNADPLGEGINVVYDAPQPHFNTPQTRGRGNAAGQHPDRPQLTTAPSRFTRDCCTVTVTQGDPAKALQEFRRNPKTYLVCTDMSSEAKFALDWAIGMVLRDGDHLVVTTVLETDTKVDNADGPVDHVAKLRNQKERESHAHAISRQVVTTVQRTRLHVTVSCQAWHAKNPRHHILDLIDLIEPVMLIVGSRGLSDLKGIILGSTSHYLIQKSSVPVMVARRRLKRPARHSAHLEHRARVPLAEASIEKEATHGERPVALEEDTVAAEDEDDSEDEKEEESPERGRRPVRFA